MKFKLPRLEGWVDVPRYPGLQVLCWLNPTNDGEEYKPPDNPQPWDTAWLQGYASLFLKMRVPAELSDGDEEQIIELGSARAIYDLMRTDGFDQSILPITMGAWTDQRHTLMELELKN